MVPPITALLQRCTGAWAMWRQPEAILAVCQAIRSTAGRARLLTPITTRPLCLGQMLHGTTACRP